MAIDTAAAIQALIKQVETLTTEISGIKKHNERLLDEKKDMQRTLAADPDAKAKMAAAGLEQINGDWYPKGTQPTHRLTREEARDTQKYRMAKAAAEKAGTQLQIVDPIEPDDTNRRASRSDIDTSLATTLIRDDDQKVAYMRLDVMGSDARQYRQLRADGMTVQQWSNADDLPQHMQTKLMLMEKTNDAD